MRQFLAVLLLATGLALYPAVVIALLVSDIHVGLAYLVGLYIFVEVFRLAYWNRTC